MLEYIGKEKKSIKWSFLYQNFVDAIDECVSYRYNENKYVVFETTLKSNGNFMVPKGVKHEDKNCRRFFCKFINIGWCRLFQCTANNSNQ